MNNLAVLMRKARSRAWQRTVKLLRNTPVYPALYASWWLSIAARPVAAQSTNYLSAVPNRGAGIGHQMANWIAGAWFARRFGLEFAHTPFVSESWERLLGLGEGDAEAHELVKAKGYKKVVLPLFDEHNEREVARIKRIIDSYRRKKAVFFLEQDQGYGDQHGMAETLRRKFYAVEDRHRGRIIYEPEAYNVAIHVRRGDITVGQLNRNPNLLMRWQDSEYFEKVLESVVGNLRVGKPIKVYLFSQGKKEEFKRFERYADIQYCLDMGAQDSFLHMAYADLLITSKSSFSYKPALLSRGVKVCPRHFWHGYPDAQDWILADEDGSLDAISLGKIRLLGTLHS